VSVEVWNSLVKRTPLIISARLFDREIVRIAKGGVR
jgi:hypothetical protein